VVMRRIQHSAEERRLWYQMLASDSPTAIEAGSTRGKCGRRTTIRKPAG
jgi:hypothetical protein